MFALWFKPLTRANGSFRAEERDASGDVFAPRVVHSLGATSQEVFGGHHSDEHQVALRVVGRLMGLQVDYVGGG